MASRQQSRSLLSHIDQGIRLCSSCRVSRARVDPLRIPPHTTVLARDFSRSHRPIMDSIKSDQTSTLPASIHHIHKRYERRHASSDSAGDSSSGRFNYLITGMVGIGTLITAYGLLDYYFSSRTWPEPVRSHLKAALKAKYRGDYESADGFFREAITAATSISPLSLSPDPLLKLSGIYISLSSMLESKGDLSRAYSTLSEALNHFGAEPLKAGASLRGWAGTGLPEGYALTEADHVRAVGITQKLGHLAVQLSSDRKAPPFPLSPSASASGSALTSDNGALSNARKGPLTWLEAAEHHLSNALAAMLKLGLAAGRQATPDQPIILGRDLDLPEGQSLDNAVDEGDEEIVGRVDKRGVGMTMEALSEVYARRGKYDLANQLLIQAISLLIPPTAKQAPPVRDRCQAALLMTTLSSHLSRPQTADSIRISRSWSLKALQIADGALMSAGADSSAGDNAIGAQEGAIPTCMQARSVGAFNLGMLAEMERDDSGAAAYFEQAGELARKIGFKEGQREAMSALRRIRAGSGSTAA